MKPELKSTQELSRLLQRAHILLRALIKTKLGETGKTAVSHGPEAGTKVCWMTNCDRLCWAGIVSAHSDENHAGISPAAADPAPCPSAMALGDGQSPTYVTMPQQSFLDF